MWDYQNIVGTVFGEEMYFDEANLVLIFIFGCIFLKVDLPKSFVDGWQKLTCFS